MYKIKKKQNKIKIKDIKKKSNKSKQDKYKRYNAILNKYMLIIKRKINER